MKGLFGRIYQGRKVLVTGHTGFKGSWLCAWLKMLGSDLSGISTPDYENSKHFQVLNMDCQSHFGDIRDRKFVNEIVSRIRPEIVFHLAAQSLVRDSYRDPVATWETNVMGTLNLFEACRTESSVKAVVNVTTDKVYENIESNYMYKESDSLGGYDPYSSSKAASEILTGSYRRSFLQAPGSFLLASARAGNVIGGGDWARERLIPDLVRSTESREPVNIRYPQSVRPWQHVLEPLSAYLLLGQRLLSGDAAAADAWNFGPTKENCVTVGELTGIAKAEWDAILVDINRIAPEEYHEAGMLMLESKKAKEKLGWGPVWDLRTTAKKTLSWYRNFHSGNVIGTNDQVISFVNEAKSKGYTWAGQ